MPERNAAVSDVAIALADAAMSRVGSLLNRTDVLIAAMLDVLEPEGTVIAYTSWDSVHEGRL